MRKRRVLIVFPTNWDRKQFQSCRHSWADRYELIFAEPTDEDCPWDYDIMGFIDRAVQAYSGKIDGVMSSSDYPGATVAGAIASRLGLPGSRPENIIGASHKYYSRLVQRRATPEATPPFELVDPLDPDPHLDALGYPCFIKPVKGAFSVMSRRIRSEGELKEFLQRPAVREFCTHYVALFNQMVGALTDFEVDGRHFLVEGLLRGHQATVEGFVHGTRSRILGIVDSIQHPETGSFVRFDYPSGLPLPIRERMEAIAGSVVGALGLEDTFFNIEMIHDQETDRIGIIEVNPRICGQFADLYEKVDGASSVQLALDLAVGDEPTLVTGAGQFTHASSHPLRIFQPMRVVHAPDRDAIGEVEAEFAGTLVWVECETGQTLQDFERSEDGQSCRYGIINVGGRSAMDVETRLTRILARLGIRLEPL